MKLYEIITELQDLEQYLEEYADNNGGVLPDDALARLNELESHKDRILTGFYKSIKNRMHLDECIDAEIEIFEAGIAKLKLRKAKNERTLEGLKSLIGQIIGEGTKYANGIVNFSWRASEELVTDKTWQYPDTFYRSKVTKTLSKEDMKKYIKEGGTVENAYILKKQNLQVK
jgi:hypothetical protein